MLHPAETLVCIWYNAPTMLPATGWQHRGCITSDIHFNGHFTSRHLKFISTVKQTLYVRRGVLRIK